MEDERENAFNPAPEDLERPIIYVSRARHPLRTALYRGTLALVVLGGSVLGYAKLASGPNDASTGRPPVQASLGSRDAGVGLAGSSPTVATEKSAAEAQVNSSYYDNDRLLDRKIYPTDVKTYRNFETPCKLSPTRIARIFRSGSLAQSVSNFLGFSASKAEAAVLEETQNRQTREELLQCLRNIEEISPSLTSSTFADEQKFTRVQVDSLRPEDVIGIDAAASWVERLPEELLKRGFMVSRDEVRAAFNSLKITFRDPATGAVGVFTPVFYEDKAEVERRRSAAVPDLRARWIGEDFAIIFDPRTNQLIFVEQNQDKGRNCDNIAVPIPIIPVPETPTPTVTATVTATATATPPTGEAPAPTPTSPPGEDATPTATSTRGPGDTPTPTITPAPTNTHTILTPTRSPEATATATPPPTETPTPVPTVASPTPTVAPTNTHTILTPTKGPENTPTAVPTSVPLATPTRGSAIPTPTQIPI